MSELPDPIADALEDTASEERVARLWRGIERGRAPRRAAPRAALGALALAAAVALVWLGVRSDPASAPAPDVALALAGGAPLARVHERDLALSDGSRVTLEPGARLEVLRNDGHAASWLLVRGRARFEVTPAGPRVWTVEAGLATVEVVGTVFTVTRDERGVEVAVERGVVLARGERVPDRVRRLEAGDTLRVEPPAAAERAARDDGAPASALAAAPETARAPDEAASDEATRVAPVRPAPEPAAAPRPRPDASRAPRAGRRARAAGRVDEAAQLPVARRRARRRPAAGLAAFTLGRLEADGSATARAADTFARALAHSLPPRLREDAMARRVEALERAGRADDARAAASAYLEAYPSGRHAARLRAASGRE
ncbi:MAG: FecR domain-containing protein [Sandaracinaceae bacterium]|nr:FecR domain-containing protein [Sandaracinaceae bacterium]